MNVFDFDKTIFRGDSTQRFYFFCLKRHPKMLLHVPSLITSFFKYMVGTYTKTQFKQTMYRFLTCIHDIDKQIDEFWDKNEHRIFKWYLDIKKQDDVVISASPEFLLEPICKKLGIGKLMASRVDKHTGIYSGENCYGEEKVLRYRKLYKDSEMDSFFSDSLSDTPLANLAKDSHIITSKGKVIDWKDYKPSFFKRLKDQFLCAEFITYALIGCGGIFSGIILAYLFSKFLQPNISFILGYITNITLLYFLNTHLTFHEKTNGNRYLRFLLSYVPNFIIQNICVIIFYNTLSFPELVSYLLAALIGGPITFIIVKLFAFNK